MTTASVTGHRPDKLGGYHCVTASRLNRFAVEVLVAFEPDQVVTGMALGWDTAIAWACLSLGIPFVAAVPFAGQQSRWRVEQRAEYERLLAKAAHVFTISPGEFSSAKMQRRNEWMVDNSDYVIALWNGSSGGTKNCVDYARGKRKIIANVWDRWESHP